MYVPPTHLLCPTCVLTGVYMEGNNYVSIPLSQAGLHFPSFKSFEEEGTTTFQSFCSLGIIFRSQHLLGGIVAAIGNMAVGFRMSD